MKNTKQGPGIAEFKEFENFFKSHNQPQEPIANVPTLGKTQYTRNEKQCVDLTKPCLLFLEKTRWKKLWCDLPAMMFR